ncbi:MAG: CBS domain-containing protein [Candidatus Micrarchaeia archaeon]
MPAVATIMHKHIVGVAPTTRLYAAARLLNVSKVPLMPVLENDVLVGIVTRNAIEKALKEEPDDTQISKIMSRPVFVAMSDDINDASEKMIKRRLPRLPVVNNKIEMLCVGVVSSTDIVAVKDLPKKTAQK